MELHSRTYGDGPATIVFLHGVFGQGRNWTQIAKALADDVRCVLVDAPNHGHSPWTDHLDYPSVATIIADNLADWGLVGPQVTLLGHSMGGKLAMRIALERPQSIGRLAVVDVAPRAKSLSSLQPLVAAMRSLPLEDLTSRADAERWMAERVPDDGVRGFLLQNLRPTADGWQWGLNLEVIGDNLDVIAGWPTPSGTQFDGPTLWVAGADSDYVRPEDTAAMRALFPATQKVIVKGAGHWVQADQPMVIIDLLRRFCVSPQQPA